MIGHCIPRENEHWQLYLLLLDIVDILLAPDAAVKDTALLSVLIQDHQNSSVESQCKQQRGFRRGST